MSYHTNVLHSVLLTLPIPSRGTQTTVFHRSFWKQLSTDPTVTYSFLTGYSASHRFAISYLIFDYSIKSMENVICKQMTMSFEDCEHCQLTVNCNLGKDESLKRLARSSTRFAGAETTYF